MRLAALVPCHDALNLLFDRAVDDEDTINPILAAGFKQQRHGNDAVPCIELAELGLDFPVHQGMQQVLQHAAQAGICKDRMADLFSQQGSLVVKIRLPECLEKLFADGFGFRKVTGNDIRIDDRDTEVILEDFGDGRFATADTACQAYD